MKNGEHFDVADLSICNTYELDRNSWGVISDGLTCEKSQFGKQMPMLLEIFASYRVNEQQLAAVRVDDHRAGGEFRTADHAQSVSPRRQIRTAFVPPNAKEFDMAVARLTPVRATPGT